VKGLDICYSFSISDCVTTFGELLVQKLTAFLLPSQPSFPTIQFLDPDKPRFTLLSNFLAALDKDREVPATPAKNITLRELDWGVKTRRAFVCGEVGGGKTFLFQTECYRLARDFFKELNPLDLDTSSDTQKKACPIYLPLENLAIELSHTTGNILSGFLEAVRLTYPLPAPEEQQVFDNWLIEKIKRGECLLWLDGLDETTTRLQSQLANKLAELSNSINCPVFISCKTSNIMAFEFFQNLGYIGLELNPFSPPEIQEFVEARLSNNPKLINKVLKAFDRNPNLAQLAKIPLLLGFLCETARLAGKLATSRYDLYQNMIYRALENNSGPTPGLNPAEIEIDLAKLSELALNMVGLETSPIVPGLRRFSNSGRWQNVFRQSNLKPAGISFERFNQWLNCGLIVRTGMAPSGEDLYTFRHRSIQEWLIAYGVGEQIETLRPCFWLGQEWEEIIVMVVGKHSSPLSIINGFIHSNNDAFNGLLYLAGLCQTELQVKPPQILLEKLNQLLFSASARDREKAATLLAKAGGGGLNILVRALRSERRSVTRLAKQALEYLDDRYSAVALAQILKDDRENQSVREKVAAILGVIGVKTRDPLTKKVIIEDLDSWLDQAPSEFNTLYQAVKAARFQIDNPAPYLLSEDLDQSDLFPTSQASRPDPRKYFEVVSSIRTTLGKLETQPETIFELEDLTTILISYRLDSYFGEAVKDELAGSTYPLLQFLKRDLEGRLLSPATRLLGLFATPDRPVIEGLVKVMLHPNRGLRSAAWQALQRITQRRTSAAEFCRLILDLWSVYFDEANLSVRFYELLAQVAPGLIVEGQFDLGKIEEWKQKLWPLTRAVLELEN
jgi:hypothetical protein